MCALTLGRAIPWREALVNGEAVERGMVWWWSVLWRRDRLSLHEEGENMSSWKEEGRHMALLGEEEASEEEKGLYVSISVWKKGEEKANNVSTIYVNKHERKCV